MNVSEIQTAFENYKGENFDNDKFYKWLNYADRFLYEKLCLIEPEKFIKTQNFTVTGGTPNYTLPADFGHINALGTGFYSVDSEGNPVGKFFTTHYGSLSTGFYLTNSEVYFTGNLNGSIVLRYVPTRNVLSDDADSLAGGERFKDFYEQVLNKYFAIDYEEAEEEGVSEKRLKNILEEIFSNYSRNNATVSVFSGDFY